MIIRYLRLFVVFIIITSCSSISKSVYKDEGLYFEITEDFRIGRTNTFKKNKATYIPIYSRNKDVYAKFSIVWLPGHSDLDWEIQNYVDGLNSIYKSDGDKPVYSEVRTTKFGSNVARYIEYSVASQGPRIGSYTTFHCNNFTVIIGQHCSVEGQAMINKCRELIEQVTTVFRIKLDRQTRC